MFAQCLDERPGSEEVVASSPHALGHGDFLRLHHQCTLRVHLVSQCVPS